MARGRAHGLWQAAVAFGLFALAHAAFSAAQYRAYTRLTEQETEDLPLDVVLQALFGLFVTLCGVVNIAGDFKDLDATAELRFKTFENMSNRPSFYSFNHRGKVLYAQPQEPSTLGATNILPITKLRRRQ
uniref:ER membrane protein complex subunit 5-like n=1 Tax=Myxine glutinosa TaxID=7769 RepID=UPI00358DF43C